jgi:hypothetical protein
MRSNPDYRGKINVIHRNDMAGIVWTLLISSFPTAISAIYIADNYY